MQIVVDTNVVVSGFFFGGLPRKLVDMIQQDSITAVVSEAIILEYERTVHYLLTKYKGNVFQAPFSSLLTHFKHIGSISDIQICRDSDDNKFISCAYDGRCSLIVSGDKDLLTLKEYQGIKIVTVREFFNEYYKTES
jgi:putative PIN family toxin of toxin-antitoxin system